MSKHHNKLPTKISFFIWTSGKIEGMQDSKLNFSSSCFNADDSHVKIVWLHAVTFSENDVLYFWDIVDLFKHYSGKAP